jgi:hypothetical protein
LPRDVDLSLLPLAAWFGAEDSQEHMISSGRT